MIFGYLYERGFIKNGGKLFRFWCWLAYQKWYQAYLIPMHIVKGYYYGYTTKQIYYFIKGVIVDKLYKERLKNNNDR